MGYVRASIPVDLVKALAHTCGIEAAVETGTFYGGGSRALRHIFPRVWSIEASEEMYRKTKRKFGRIPGLTFLLGSSPDVLASLADELDEPAVFWLDAHAATTDYGIPDSLHQCPLLEELDVIRKFPGAAASCLLIDDARAFFGPMGGLPITYRPEEWPSFVEIVDKLRQDGNRYVTMLDDVIIAVPSHVRPVVDQWWSDVQESRDGLEAYQYLYRKAEDPNPVVAVRKLVRSLLPSRVKSEYFQFRRRVGEVVRVLRR
jgi:hypothetical protein